MNPTKSWRPHTLSSTGMLLTRSIFQRVRGPKAGANASAASLAEVPGSACISDLAIFLSPNRNEEQWQYDQGEKNKAEGRKGPADLWDGFIAGNRGEISSARSPPIASEWCTHLHLCRSMLACASSAPQQSRAVCCAAHSTNDLLGNFPRNGCVGFPALHS